MTKFIDGIDEIENVVEVITKLREINFNDIAGIIMLLKKHTAKIICEYISQNATDFSALQLIFYMNLFIESIADLTVSNVLQILKQLFNTHDDVSLTKSICTIMQKRKDIFGKQRKEQVELMYSCFHLTTSTEIKKTILETIQLLGMTNMFKAKCDDNEQRFVNSNLS